MSVVFAEKKREAWITYAVMCLQGKHDRLLTYAYLIPKDQDDKVKRNTNKINEITLPYAHI